MEYNILSTSKPNDGYICKGILTSNIQVLHDFVKRFQLAFAGCLYNVE